jgi:hypothetical protein
LKYLPASSICQRYIFRKKPTGAARYLTNEELLFSTGAMLLNSFSEGMLDKARLVEFFHARVIEHLLR